MTLALGWMLSHHVVDYVICTDARSLAVGRVPVFRTPMDGCLFAPLV